jgi:hypothetical protein
VDFDGLSKGSRDSQDHNRAHRTTGGLIADVAAGQQPSLGYDHRAWAHLRAVGRSRLAPRIRYGSCPYYPGLAEFATAARQAASQGRKHHVGVHSEADRRCGLDTYSISCTGVASGPDQDAWQGNDRGPLRQLAIEVSLVVWQSV